MTRILVLGAYGMLGHKLLHVLAESANCDVVATCRSRRHAADPFERAFGHLIVEGVAAQDPVTVERVLKEVRPDVVVNCIGIIKQLKAAKDAITSIEVNSLFPHRLARLCSSSGARLVHLSTDCVFDGSRGAYVETDNPTPTDLYGRSKLLGELVELPALTLRTSIIGHELARGVSLVDWFLSQSGTVKGFTRAIYTGFPTIVLAGLIRDLILRSEPLFGLYQAASTPISKFELLKLVATAYGCIHDIRPSNDFHCDRSLKADRLTAATGFCPAPWPELVQLMQQDYQRCDYYRKERQK
ncbi:SDR family oxidoreductase [Kamptonema cortianum]|nr:SDR family oxidoreductase [Oscillatoria laete-virens]MDK3155398.1 SDR family oxidoreductase [Kamptonema cortianum]MDL5046145.1 SDR family oxidoreductase [Oscillatoria amoena NRMC-F 0135]MDL5052843.1 SDR family oxidoreductase [Oscillatoria laete-virens NRMC-F 0139]